MCWDKIDIIFWVSKVRISISTLIYMCHEHFWQPGDGKVEDRYHLFCFRSSAIRFSYFDFESGGGNSE